MPILTSYSSGISLLPHFPRNCAAASRSSKLGHWLRRVFKPLKICIKKPHAKGISEKTIIGMSTWFSHPLFSLSKIARVLRNCLWTVLNAEDLSSENFKCPKDYLPELVARFFCFSKTCEKLFDKSKRKDKRNRVPWRNYISSKTLLVLASLTFLRNHFVWEGMFHTHHSVSHKIKHFHVRQQYSIILHIAWEYSRLSTKRKDSDLCWTDNIHSQKQSQKYTLLLVMKKGILYLSIVFWLNNM